MGPSDGGRRVFTPCHGTAPDGARRCTSLPRGDTVRRYARAHPHALRRPPPALVGRPRDLSTKPAARVRHSFSKQEKVRDVPNLIDIQRSSFEWFIEKGLRETIDDISPIEDFTGTLAVQFGKYTLGGWEPGMPYDHIQPNDSIKDCREKDITYAAPLTMEVAFINRETGEIREQKVFMGDLPLMTDWGTYIINGTERVVVTQLVRSPGAYVMEPKDRDKQVFIANLMPSRGSWVELEIDKKGLVNVRIDRKRKLPITTLLRALPAIDENTGFEIDKTDEGL